MMYRHAAGVCVCVFSCTICACFNVCYVYQCQTCQECISKSTSNVWSCIYWILQSIATVSSWSVHVYLCICATLIVQMDGVHLSALSFVNGIHLIGKQSSYSCTYELTSQKLKA